MTFTLQFTKFTKIVYKKVTDSSYYIADLVYLSKLQVDSVQSSNAWVTNSLPNSIGESKNYRKTTAFFEVLCLVCMCNSSVAAAAGQLDEYNNKGTEGSLGSSQTQTQTLFTFKLIYTYMQSSHVLCFLHALDHFVTLLVCQGLDFHVSFHHYTCMHRSNWDSLIKQHSEYIQCGASVLRCPRTVLVLG